MHPHGLTRKMEKLPQLPFRACEGVNGGTQKEHESSTGADEEKEKLAGCRICEMQSISRNSQFVGSQQGVESWRRGNNHVQVIQMTMSKVRGHVCVHMCACATCVNEKKKKSVRLVLLTRCVNV